MRLWLALLLVSILGCQERYLDTPKLVEARKQEASVTKTGTRKQAGPPAELAKALTGGKQTFQDGFDRTHAGERWTLETPEWRIEEGELVNRKADNAGAWLLEQLPEGNVRVEFDVRSMPFAEKAQAGGKRDAFPGDLKCEAFNMEPKHQTGYIFIFGGWNNRVNRIARLEEHGNGPGAAVADGPVRPVEPGHTYRMKVVRVGATVGYYADDQYLTHFTDSSPIKGRYFGFNNWRSDLHFDNLAVFDLGQATAPPAKPAPSPAK